MPIERVTDEEARILVFHVSEEIEVCCGTDALILDHLLNHIRLLCSVAGGVVTQSDAKFLSQYPHYGVGKDRYERGGSPEKLGSIVLNECEVLLRYLQQIVAEVSDDGKAGLYEEAQSKVRFLNYRYPNDPFPSDEEHDEA